MVTRNNNPNNEFDLKEYIDYLIIEKNIFSIRNIVLIMIAIGAISIAVILNLKITEEYVPGDEYYFSQEYKDEVLINAGYSVADIEKMTEDKKNLLFNEVYFQTKGIDVGKDNILGEYPKEESSKTRNEYYKMASLGDFSEIVNDFEDKKLVYRFSQTYNKTLVSIYNDAYLINKSFSSDKDHFMKKQMLYQIADPRMLLFATLYLEREYRDEFIIDKLSLSPTLINKSIRIDSFKSIYSINISNDDSFKDDSKIDDMCKYLLDGEFIFYKIAFKIDGSNLIAYLYKDISNAKLRIFGIYPQNKDEIHPYPLVTQKDDVSDSDYEEYYTDSKQNLENSLNEYLESISEGDSNSNSNSEKYYNSLSNDNNSDNNSQTYEVPL